MSIDVEAEVRSRKGNLKNLKDFIGKQNTETNIHFHRRNRSPSRSVSRSRFERHDRRRRDASPIGEESYRRRIVSILYIFCC